jgi:NAD(P)-dependent dehydrogenase (short-subunit alcohol dehydrogenase family)
MRVFVAGATGALGRHLVPGLVAAGHEVTATTRTPGKVAQLRDAGAEPVVVDGLDREAVIAAVRAARPEVAGSRQPPLGEHEGLPTRRALEREPVSLELRRRLGAQTRLPPALRRRRPQGAACSTLFTLNLPAAGLTATGWRGWVAWIGEGRAAVLNELSTCRVAGPSPDEG